jgi:hypothetical protein
MLWFCTVLFWQECFFRVRKKERKKERENWVGHKCRYQVQTERKFFSGARIFHILRPCRHSNNKQVCVFLEWVLGVGCWMLGLFFLFGFLGYDHGFAPAGSANSLTGWVLQILLQILLPSSSGSALRFQ